MCVLYVKSNDNCMIQLEISDLCVCVLFSQNSKWNEWCKKQKTNRNQWMRWFMDKWRGNQIETEIKLQTNNIEILAEFKNVSRHKIGSNGCFSVFYVE